MPANHSGTAHWETTITFTQASLNNALSVIDINYTLLAFTIYYFIVRNFLALSGLIAGILQTGQVDLLHLQHGLHHPLGLDQIRITQ